MKFGADNDLCSGAGQKQLPANILQLYPDNLLDVGNQIVVQGKVGNAELIEVFLFREALEWNRISERIKLFILVFNLNIIFNLVGQTVLRIQINASTITFNSYIVCFHCKDPQLKPNISSQRPFGHTLKREMPQTAVRLERNWLKASNFFSKFSSKESRNSTFIMMEPMGR